jgi:hypothetical protein
MLETSTVSPTLSSDHFNCFWLGTHSPQERHGNILRGDPRKRISA